jgi:hypothetical protein
VTYECELVLQANDHETRRPHTFLADIRPGTYLRLDGWDWIVNDITRRSDGVPEIICRPANERL